MPYPLVHIKEIIMMPIEALKPHPDNPNDHTDKQIERLAKIIQYQGWRLPIKVSNRSKCITSGHGRLMAAQLMGWPLVPVSMQDYDDEEMEYADVVADNSIALWSEINKAKVNEKLVDLDGSTFDLDLLGIEDFTIDIADRELPAMDDTEHMRQITLHYNPEIYDHITNRLDQMADKLGLETPEAVIAHLLDVNI